MSGDAPALTVYTACNPSDRGISAGAEHLVLSTDFASGRLRREAGDALCKPWRKFWGLYAEPERKPSCKRCLELAQKHGLDLPGGASDERTQGEK